MTAISPPQAAYDKTFIEWVQHLIREEGGISTDQRDPAHAKSGHYTNKGITTQTYNALAKKVGVTTPQNKLTDDDVAKFARYFWDTAGGDKYSDPAISAFMAEVFWGSGYAGLKDIQKRLGLKADGKIGPKTIDAINSKPPKIMLDQLLKWRLEFLKGLENSSVFTGWFGRLDRFGRDFKAGRFATVLAIMVALGLMITGYFWFNQKGV